MQYTKTGLSILATMMLTLTGCGGSSSSGSSDDGGSPVSDTASYAPLDATDSASAAYLDLASGHTVSEAEPWQMAYQKYVGFSINSGDGVEACIAKQYDELYDGNGDAVKDEFMALNKDNTIADFNAVTRTSCTDFSTDGATSQFKDWYTYDMGTHVITVNTDDSNGWIVRSSTDDGNGNYAYTRLKATAYDANGITFNSELWDNNTQTFQAAVSTGPLDASGGTVYWNMEDNTSSTTEMAGWDLKLESVGHSTEIFVNGGVSGDGDAGVGSALQVANVDAVTDPTDTNQVYKYFGDSASGPMTSPGSYGAFEYGVGGDNHDMWPTFAVYLFKDGDRYYKAQVVSNYGSDGSLASGNLYIRYEEVFE